MMILACEVLNHATIYIHTFLLHYFSMFSILCFVYFCYCNNSFTKKKLLFLSRLKWKRSAMALLCIEIFIWLDGLVETLHLMMLDWYVHLFFVDLFT